MYQENIPSKFKTEHGSIYTVVPHDVIRQKYDGSIHQGNGKNIYFYENSSADDLAEDGPQMSDGKVYTAAGGVYVLQYKVPGEGENLVIKVFTDLSRTPEVDLAPLDMRLKQDGTFEVDHRFHVGDKIIELL